MSNDTSSFEMTEKESRNFWAKVDKSGDCWIWTASKSRGYGAAYVGQKCIGAHRVSYMLHNGVIDGSTHVDHTCFTRACVNPAHLRGVTPKANQEHRQGPSRASTTGVRGVSYRAKWGCYEVSVQHNGKSIYGGSYKTLAEAEMAAVGLRNKLFTHNDVDRRPNGCPNVGGLTGMTK